jgi:hypothetical protein
MSTHISEGLDPLLSARFMKWKQHFLLELKSPGPKASWRFLITKECDSRDLLWLLFWSVHLASIARTVPDVVTTLNELRASVLKDVDRLQKHLRNFMNVRLAGHPFWFALVSHKAEIQQDTADFGMALLMILRTARHLEGMKVKTTVKSARSKAASHGEAWLHAYVVCRTRRLQFAHVSVLLEAAARAYGGLNAKSFSQEAVGKRYARYRKFYVTDHQEVVEWLAEFWCEREGGNDIELLPFLIARSAISRQK